MHMEIVVIVIDSPFLHFFPPAYKPIRVYSSSFLCFVRILAQDLSAKELYQQFA